jgi:hypothetical protein
MNHALVIRGRYAGQTFIPTDPMPLTEGTAQLIVFPYKKGDVPPPDQSIFDLIGKSGQKRSGDDIQTQVMAEQSAWRQT